jgi:phosphoribosylamine--glycine ligase
MNILVLGSGGREHALTWGLAKSPGRHRLFCAPGNPGIARHATLVSLPLADHRAVADWVAKEHIDLTIVGPEQPLAEGIVDHFTERGLPVFGPTRRAAELEWSKAFAKEFMQRHRIPTAASCTFSRGQEHEAAAYLREARLPVVLKADGLAAGKGVLICATRDEAERELSGMLAGTSFGAAGRCVVVEEFLTGEEASVFAVTDGRDYILLAPAQDHKRALDNDGGKNTGGMGAYAPTPVMTPGLLQQVEQDIIRPTLDGMASEGRTYRGCLYVGLMMTPVGPKVIEYNARFGDPETQVVLPLFAGDLAGLLHASAAGGMDAFRSMSWSPRTPGTAVCVILASGGYPDAYASGKTIAGLDRLNALPGIMAFHAGTRSQGDALVTSGGRVLGVTAVHPAGVIADAIRDAYRAVALISFEGMHYRHDIGRRALDHARGEQDEHRGHP